VTLPSAVAFDLGVDRQEGCRPMMLWPVELDATADPGTGQADERRFDHG
jgi:hypothetical protein